MRCLLLAKKLIEIKKKKKKRRSSPYSLFLTESEWIGTGDVVSGKVPAWHKRGPCSSPGITKQRSESGHTMDTSLNSESDRTLVQNLLLHEHVL